MKGLLTSVPDGRYKLTAFAADESRSTVVATAEFHGTQTGEGGPVAPTGKSVVSDFAYVMKFDGDKISHKTNIWNDVFALRGLGWAQCAGASSPCCSWPGSGWGCNSKHSALWAMI